MFDIEKKDIDNVNSVLTKLMMISFVFVLLPSVNLRLVLSIIRYVPLYLLQLSLMLHKQMNIHQFLKIDPKNATERFHYAHAFK